MPRFREACTAVLALFAMGAAAGQSPPPVTLGSPVPVSQLATMCGGSDTTNNINTQALTGAVNDNQANNTVSGGNLVSGSAFGGAAGLPTVIQNSGNNVLIQNATIVTVRMVP
ncbi:hypothetical protein GCM10009552_00690 [Rothia nasimurium]|nr:hypothetical protein [Luteibacter anthropi]